MGTILQHDSKEPDAIDLDQARRPNPCVLLSEKEPAARGN